MATVNAESASLAHVSAAVDAASDGDTVVVPAGEATWSGGVTVPDAKVLTIQGNGIGSTVITQGSQGDYAFVTNNNTRLTGFEFVGGSLELRGGDALRVDHCKFTTASQNDSILVANYDNPPVHPCGVIDNCVFVNGRIVVNGTKANLTDGNHQHQLWAEDFAYGSDDYMYVEDCDFSANVTDNAIDGNYGGRYVFRYNTLTDIYIEAHSVQGNNRALRRWEIYENTIQCVGEDLWAPMFIRGGTGVIFNNTILDFNETIVLNNVRDQESVDTCGQCNGASTWDENTTDEAGWACRDQIGRGRDTTLWVAGEAYTQVSEPAYIWGNTADGSPTGVTIHAASTPNHIQEDRDYYLSEKPDYTPYTYPHPLRGEAPAAAVGYWIG